MDINQQIIELRLAAASTAERAVRDFREYPEVRQDLLDEASDLEWRRDQYAAIAARVRAVVDPRYDARQLRIRELQRLYADGENNRKQEHELNGLMQRNSLAPAKRLELSRYGDLQDRLFHFCFELKADFLLTQAEMDALNIRIPPSPRQVAEQEQEQAEYKRLMAIRDGIFEKMTGWDKREAQRIWNEIGGYMDDNKIVQFVERCRTAKLLSDEWLPRRVMGALLQRLLHGQEAIERGIFLK